MAPDEQLAWVIPCWNGKYIGLSLHDRRVDFCAGNFDNAFCMAREPDAWTLFRFLQAHDYSRIREPERRIVPSQPDKGQRMRIEDRERIRSISDLVSIVAGISQAHTLWLKSLQGMVEGLVSNENVAGTINENLLRDIDRSLVADRERSAAIAEMEAKLAAVIKKQGEDYFE